MASRYIVANLKKVALAHYRHSGSLAGSNIVNSSYFFFQQICSGSNSIKLLHSTKGGLKISPSPVSVLSELSTSTSASNKVTYQLADTQWLHCYGSPNSSHHGFASTFSSFLKLSW